MEPTLENPDSGGQAATRRPSRVKASVVALVIAGALSTWGVASVFAASPTPAASSGATASNDGSGSSTNPTGHTCPKDAAASTAPSSTSS
ncbi:MAG: hypothetical protein M3R32_02020 [Chloroflexota bacterium]|nr:hypothetical protein [Chloroflexota bacterium]